MLQDLDETIRQILIKKGKLNGGDIDISFEQPTGEWAGGLTRPTINGYLYDIRENMELRSRQYRVEQEANNRARRILEPIRVDLSYIFTVWTRNIEDEHRLLWRVLQTLAFQGTIPQKETVGDLVNQPYPLRTKVALPSEAIHNLPDLWGVMENQLRPAINYVITASLDMDTEFESPLVLTAQFKLGEYDGRNRTLTGANGESIKVLVDHMYHVGGHVVQNGEPVVGAEITVQDHGYHVLTDPFGQYVFANIPPGDYTFQVEAEGQPIQRYPIRVPADKVNGYDLNLDDNSPGTNARAGTTKKAR